MKSIHIVVLIALAALVMAILMTAPAHAEPSKSKKPAATEKSPKKKKKKGSAPKFVNSSSQETTAERDRRLYRECKGRPNAGACSGYAS